MRNLLAMCSVILVCDFAGSQPQRAVGQEEPQPAHPVIVQMEGRNRIVTVFAGPNQPLYSVRTAAGFVEVPPMTMSALQARHPEVAEFIERLLARNDDVSFAYAGIE